MKRKLMFALSVLAALMTALALFSCAGGDAQKSGSENSKLDASEAAVDAGSYSGALLAAYDDKMVISGDDGDKEFKVDDDTVYDLGDVDAMYLDDVVEVKYHVEGTTNLVDKVLIVEHKETALEFAGTLVDSDDESVTLSSDSLTVTFQKDTDTYIVGDFNPGDEIELTYYGDLSEYPYANVIAVVNELAQPETNTVHGMVSELAGGTMLLGIDSAHAYRFGITNNTRITGAANDLSVGDRVDVSYKGSIKNGPEALTVNVVKRAEGRASTINGTVSSVGANTITLDTGEGKYTFGTNEYTKYYGDKPAAGYRSEITYTGNLDGDPVASAVYCSNGLKAAKPAASTSNAGDKSASSQSSATNGAGASSESKAGNTPSGSQAETGSSSAQPKQKPQSSSVDEGQSQGGVAPDPQEGDEPQGDEPQGDEPQGDELQGDDPQGGDEPQGDEPQGDDPQGGEEPQGDEPENPDAEGDEPQGGDEPEVTSEPENTDGDPEVSGAADGSKSDKDAKVSGKGTIVKGDEKAKTIQVKLQDGATVTLKFDADTTVASGYIPEKGDVVKLVYTSKGMLLKDIQLVSRPGDKSGAGSSNDADAPDEDDSDDGE